MIQWGVRQLSTTNRSWVMEVFLESVVLVSIQNEYTNIRRFWTIFCQKTRVLATQKYTKTPFSIQWLYNTYLKKAKSRTLSLFTKNSQIKKIIQNFGHVQDKSIDRPEIIEQTRTVTFPDQEKLLEKVDGG